MVDGDVTLQETQSYKYKTKAVDGLNEDERMWMTRMTVLMEVQWLEWVLLLRESSLNQVMIRQQKECRSVRGFRTGISVCTVCRVVNRESNPAKNSHQQENTTIIVRQSQLLK